MRLFATVIDTRRSTEIPEPNSGADLAPGEIRVTLSVRTRAVVPRGAGLDVAAVILEKYSMT